MRWYSIFVFIVLFNLTLTAMAGFDLFGWERSGLGVAVDWRSYAYAIATAGLVTGILGAVFLHGGAQVANQLVGVFFSSSGFFTTVSTCRWLDLPPGITLIVEGMTGFLAMFAIAQILSGGRYED